MTSDGAGGRVVWLVLAALLVLSIGPIFAVDVPAMVDYPNHLARMYVLSRDGTPAGSSFYQTAWVPYPNLAMDIAVPWLARLMGVEGATRAFLLISELLVISGAMMLERVVKGRLEIAPLAAALFLYSPPFAWGFLNFEFALGVALWAIAAWLATERQPWPVRATVHCVFVAVLFMAHFFALGLYGASLGLHELWRAHSGRASLRETALTLTLLAAPVLALLAVMVALGGAVGGSRTEWHLASKLAWIIGAMSGYSVYASAAGMCFVLSTAVILARRGQLQLAGSGAWIAAGFALIYVAMPFRLFDTAFADIRVLTAAAFILPAFMSLSLTGAGRRVLFFTATAFALVNLILVWSVWLSYRSEYSAMIASFNQIAKGSAVLVAQSDGGDPPDDLTEYPIYNAAALAVPYADAFVSTLYSSSGKQPITLRPAYRYLSWPQDGGTSLSLLQLLASGKMESAPAPLRSWPSNFSYLYVVGRRVPNPMPRLLTELDAGSHFVLYKIEAAGEPAGAKHSER